MFVNNNLPVWRTAKLNLKTRMFLPFNNFSNIALQVSWSWPKSKSIDWPLECRLSEAGVSDDDHTDEDDTDEGQGNERFPL